MYNTIQKTIAAWAFNHYIAYYYFDNVNVSQLKVAFERGEVELENLPIKKDALQHLNLPMEVVSGIVGSLSIKVPLLTLLTDPWVIKIKHLMLIVTPKKLQNNIDIPNNNSATNISMATTSMTTSESPIIINNNQANLELAQDLNDSSYLNDNISLDYDINGEGSNIGCDTGIINSEENKLAEFYTSFSSTVSSIVKDIYKNIRLEVESMTILFENFDYGLVKFSVDSLLLHRPKSVRNIVMNNVSIWLASPNLPMSMAPEDDELVVIHFDKCKLDVHDEASNNMQLVVLDQQPKQNNKQEKPNSSPQAATTSEIRIEGIFDGVSIEQLTRKDNNKSSEKYDTLPTGIITRPRNKDGLLLSKRNILKSDIIKLEFKLNNNVDVDLDKISEKNLHIKLDFLGMQYIHSHKIYEITKERLKNLLKFFIKLQTKQTKNTSDDEESLSNRSHLVENGNSKKDSSLNKLLIINIEEGLIYVVDDCSGSCAIPLLEFSVENCRILQCSGKYQQNGFVFAKIGCSYYNREMSTWNTLLYPWPFSLSWDNQTNHMIKSSKSQYRDILLNSEDMAEFVLTSAFIDLGDVALRRVIDDFIQSKPLSRSLSNINRITAHEYNSIFVLHNETGHRLEFAPIEQNNEFLELTSSSRNSPIRLGTGGDSLNFSLMHKLSINSRSSTSSRDSPDLYSLAKWTSVEIGETVSFEFKSLPIYRRHISDENPISRVLLLRVEGWKTLAPLTIDKTGVYFREASSDRVMNEDTYISISIDLERSSARKIISIRSPINLVNLLDATLEVHFVESNRALYIKPDSHLSVPLPYIFNKMHIRPCSVGVSMNEQPLVWDDINKILQSDSKIHICHPITITNRKHASYCTSQAYRICVSTNRDGLKSDEDYYDLSFNNPIPVFTLSFIAPLSIVNLLPCKLQYLIGEIEGTLSIGGQQKVYHVDTTKLTNINFKMNGFPYSRPISIDPGATGSFNHTLELFDKKNRSLYLNAKISFESVGEDPAIQIIIYSPYWFINKTRLPLIFKQQGAALEAAGQYREHEDSSNSILLFSFYDTELEPPYLCSMRLGKSKGSSMWCDGFKLEKGSGERRLCFIPNDDGDRLTNKSLIDINIRRGFGRYSRTMIVTLTARYGFDPLTKTPKKLSEPSPQNYKLTSYNHNVNLAERIADHAVNLFNSHHHRITSDVNVKVPGFKLTLVDNNNEKLIEGIVRDINVKCTTKSKEQILDCSIQDITINNVSIDCEKSIMLDRADSDKNDSVNTKPAIRLIMDRILGNSFGTTLFRQVQLSMCELVLNIEERLILKIIEFISFRNRRQKNDMKDLTQDLEKILHPEDDRKAKYYFDLLRIDLSSLKLSVFTSNQMSDSLQKLKAYLGLKFFGFEDAQVLLAPYFKMNVSRTFGGVFDSVTRFYKRQILEQAPRIVGQQIQNYLRFHLSDLLSTLYDEVYNKLFN